MKETQRSKFSKMLHNFKDQLTKKTVKKPPFDPVDEASEQSFPASDPPAYTKPKH